MQTIQRRQRAECWPAAGTRIVRVGTHLGNVVKESDYPLPSRCWGSNRRGTATWIWSKVTHLVGSPVSITATRKAHSSTSSAVASNVVGIVRPSDLAVFKLMTNLNLVGA